MREIIPVVWIAKYALTQGITEVREAAVGLGDGKILIQGYCFEAVHLLDATYYHKGEWSADHAEAVKQAEAMRVKKIASLRKQIANLEAMRFDEGSHDRCPPAMRAADEM